MDECLVSVVTPVYNGESWLAECIESVLAQTWQNWRYVIVNNRSTDGTLELANRYAARDSRITVIDAAEHVPLFDSMNRTIAMVDPDARYCKMLMADDWLLPEYLERAVTAALQQPAVGLVCCYAMTDRKVLFDTIRFSGKLASCMSSYMSGRDACRASLMEKDTYFFGLPSTMLIRADLIRKRKPFYDPRNQHSDEESCYDILQESDFCFVHQILVYFREHPESQTAAHQPMGSEFIGHLYALTKYGPVYLSADEFEVCRRQKFRDYYGFLARNVFRRAPGKFWRYQRERLQAVGLSLSRPRIAWGICRYLGHVVISVFSAFRGRA